MTELAAQRRARILGEVRDSGAARVSHLVELLGVSQMTVRRDVAELSRLGLVSRVHGGATLPALGSAQEPGFSTKARLRTAHKRAVAQAAAALVEPGASVALSAGTTTVEVARALSEVPDLTVVTNSPPAAQLLHETRRRDLVVVLTGGVRTPSDALVGPVAVTALRGLHVDLALLGVHGMDRQAGLSTPNLVEAETDRALLACARRCVVVADSSKWGVVGLSTIAGLTEVDVLVTDDELNAGAREALRDSVGRLVLASTPGSGPAGGVQR